MPLSKRINNLHLNSLSYQIQETAGKMESEWENRSLIPSPNHSEPSQGSSTCDGWSSTQSCYNAEYRPDLDANDNPYYYENNKLLYSLYLERMQRMSEIY